MSPRRAEAGAGYRVVIYCPDRHIVYDGRTPEQVGVGGGITARVRMARALRRVGHRVTMVVNCPRPAEFDGVEYLPLEGVARLSGDVVVLTTSGGGLDLTPALALDVRARLRAVWVHGPTMPKGFESLAAEEVYAVSNYIARIVRSAWGVPGDRIFVVHNGFDEAVFGRAERQRTRRDPHRLVYFSHPSKGLEASLGVLRHLRAADPRYHLIVCGGGGLWGEVMAPPASGEAVIDRGLLGQAALASVLLSASFSLHLQRREEPGSLAIAEAQRAGCVALASPVGCFPEYIADGVDGYLIPGDPDLTVVQSQAAARLLQLAAAPQALDDARRRAQTAPFDTDLLARVWTADWDRRLSRGRPPTESPCTVCGASAVVLPDGAHCTVCGHFDRRRLPVIESSDRKPKYPKMADR